MLLSSAGLSRTGRRSNNEDALCLAPPLGFFAVADGVGGYEGGEVASNLSVNVLREFIEVNRRDPEGTWPCRAQKQRSYEENLLAAGVVAAHQAVVARKQGMLAQMGSTVVAVLATSSALTVAHVGDSRLYRLRAGQLAQLTRDHSLFAEMERAGLVTDRATFHWKNQITRALGLEGGAMADVATVPVEEGDRFLLCSDGVFDPLSDETLISALSMPCVEACESLLEAAFTQGSNDNMTAIVLSFGDSLRSRG